MCKHTGEALEVFDRLMEGWEYQDRPVYSVEIGEFTTLLEGGGKLLYKNKDIGYGAFRHTLKFKGKTFAASTSCYFS